jgi:hypothetical protein
VDAALSTGVRINDVAVDPTADRLLVSFRLGGTVAYQAMFVADGAITPRGLVSTRLSRRARRYTTQRSPFGPE